MNFKVYLIVINILLFLLYGWDKFCAKKRLQRIPEKTLFFLALIGGGLGGFMGQMFFRHKTKKLVFYIINIIGVFIFTYLIYKFYPEYFYFL